MFKQRLFKPDGRELLLYGNEPIPEGLVAPAPGGGRTAPPTSHLRWHPLRGEWVVYAAHRQTRTFLPPPEFNPLSPTRDPEMATEVPAGPWQVAVFENLFPALSETSLEAPPALVETRPAKGRCEVVVYTQDSHASFGGLPLARLDLVLQVWADRYRELAARSDVEYVFAFENRGVEVGVTLHHPHGQIYAYPFVPPIAARARHEERIHFEAHGRGLLEQMIEGELADGRRLLYPGEHAVAWVPVCARYAYEIWVAPRRPAAALPDLDDAERLDLARALKTALLKLDGLWSRPMPYVLAIHQAPTRGPSAGAHLHVEIYPAYRMPGRLKYLAGSEVGAGVFTADTLPEDKAVELRAVEVFLA